MYYSVKNLSDHKFLGVGLRIMSTFKSLPSWYLL